MLNIFPLDTLMIRMIGLAKIWTGWCRNRGKKITLHDRKLQQHASDI